MLNKTVSRKDINELFRLMTKYDDTDDIDIYELALHQSGKMVEQMGSYNSHFFTELYGVARDAEHDTMAKYIELLEYLGFEIEEEQ